MKSLLVCFLLFAGHISIAQVFTIKTIDRGEGYKFPLIESKQRPAVAKKMNDVIQTDLGTNPGYTNPFDSVNFEDEYSFEVGVVNESIISLTVTGAHSGCGYHVTTNRYLFNSRTGENIDIGKIYAADGEAKLKKALHKMWVESIKPLVSDGTFGETYKECLAAAQKNPDIYIAQTFIKNYGISYRAGYCLDGSNSNVDQASGPYDLSFGQLLHILSPTGFALFIDQPSGPLRNLLRGTIDGKYPISLVLLPGKTSDMVGGLIVYDRIGTPINLAGKVQGNQIVFNELDEANNPLSNIEVTWDGKKLTGSFTNLKTRKQMPFLASAVTQP
ncbi:MAG TPA: hypothetical protein VFE50_00140 [Cyclobacteriaceae bacterium]|nr:hypothetical protein [Cyclobacteriaceae bacterium]